ncbi:head-tail joining protein [Pseudaminobacter soli (ex Li et al. 2025)]|uniref:Uncharacterized protein n=1 Tax=Pseudaminobacter soli (ex Li et al. 2025) TaxID=1295366 RepID=A0A2P7RZV6_9HYPH|nr:hypothetical protein [Mesorhizobium soli]PSJ55765.1 hypothetical protein C7I85_26095 [Mesorhizobium soli]
MDWQALLYGPNYAVFGVPATLIIEDGPTLTLTVIDKTTGVEVGGSVDVQTVLPAATVRATELASIDLADLEDAKLTFNGKTWRVDSHLPKPSPKGEADGEIYLFLSEK